jgi:osmoprotectant transport system substrate-binding protein
MRKLFRNRVFGAVVLALALVTAACGGSSGGDVEDGPTITVTSFNFPESTILAEIYAQALEDRGYSVERQLNLGSREVIFPEIESGNIDLLPEYLGSALQVGFGADAPATTDDGVDALSDAFADLGMVVLDPAPGQDKNVFVVTDAFADANGLSSVADLASAGEIVLGGPPECEERATCYAGVVETYGLDNLGFESIAEGSARIAALENGEIDVSLLFSTQPVITEKGFVALEDTEGLIAPENIIPVVSQEVVDAYGDDLTSLLNSISSEITTEVLLDLNGRVELDAQNPEDVAAEWLSENGFVG